MAPTSEAVRERVAWWGTTGQPPAGMIDAMTNHLIRRLHGDHGQEDGDPERAARVILDVVDLDQPPLGLLLGSHAPPRAGGTVERRSAEGGKWAFLNERTDFQEVAP